MIGYLYKVNLYEQEPFGGEKRPIETCAGIVEAEDHSTAQMKTLPLVKKRIVQLQNERDIIVACGKVFLSLASEDDLSADHQVHAFSTPTLGARFQHGQLTLSFMARVEHTFFVHEDVERITEFLNRFVEELKGSPDRRSHS